MALDVPGFVLDQDHDNIAKFVIIEPFLSSFRLTVSIVILAVFDGVNTTHADVVQINL